MNRQHTDRQDRSRPSGRGLEQPVRAAGTGTGAGQTWRPPPLVGLAREPQEPGQVVRREGADHLAPHRTGVPGGVIRRAGHTDAWTFTKDRHYVIKITSDAEADVYAQAGQTGIQGVIPGRVAQLNSYADIARFDPVRTLRQPQATERIIVIENLAQKDREEDLPPVILDAKIGFITASKQQAAQEGVTLPGVKSARHYLIDTVMFDSREKGYRFEEGQEWIDMVRNFSRTGRYSDMSPTWLHPKAVAGILDKVVRDLFVIHNSMVGASITFLGSSVLLIISPSNPDASKAKMIDFAHPIKKADEEPERFEKYRSNYTLGLAGLIRDLVELKDELTAVTYVDEFDSATTALELHDIL